MTALTNLSSESRETNTASVVHSLARVKPVFFFHKLLPAGAQGKLQVIVRMLTSLSANVCPPELREPQTDSLNHFSCFFQREEEPEDDIKFFWEQARGHAR